MTDRSHTPKGQRARDRIVTAAETLLATRGFHGTSTREVAAAAKLPLATTIYHFPRQEQLYAAVLERIAAELVDELATVGREPDADLALDQLAQVLARWAARRPDRVRLLLRELLDNPLRLPHVHKLPLAPVLAHAAAIVRAGVAAGVADVDDAELCVLHFVGALSYFVAARPTVERIVGPRARASSRPPTSVR
ncbi:MAG: TetR/AcrR family transcriptional regulator [Kofleriaceae bacterium]